jgi:hypothetical protein
VRTIPIAIAIPVATLLAGAACGSPGPATRPASAGPSSPPPASSPAARLFDFRVGKWVNLHQLLYARTSRWGPERDADEPQDPGWQAALDHYATAFDHRHFLALLEDPALAPVNRRLSEIGDGPLRGLDPVLTGHLERAGASYDRLWPRDRERNRAWIAALEPALARHGDALAGALAAAYGAPWPERPIRVDVSIHAGPVGAYTVLDPPHVTITSSSPKYTGDAALEMIFHEASHALVGPLSEKLAAECARQGKPLPPQLWHALLFYTTGEVVRRRLGASYVPYADANGLWARGFAELERPIKQHWPAYLDGSAGMEAALARLVASLPAAPATAPAAPAPPPAR